jgi:predicted type I restriction-modification enzyme, subunit S
MITTLPQNWIFKPLKYVDDFVSDSLSETISPGYRFRYVDISSVSSEVGIENYSETTFAESPSRARKRVVAGDTIVSTVRTYLKAIALIDDADDVIVSTGFSVIRARDHISDYLYYLCTSDLFCQQVNKYSWGIAYPAISEKLMGRILVPVPPKEEQALIAGFLDEKCASIDATVSILEKQIATLERYRASVIHEAVTKGLNPDAPMKPSGVNWIGDIPEKWQLKRIKFMFDTSSGATPESSNWDLYDGGINWIQSGDLYARYVITETGRTVSNKALSEVSALKIYKAPFVVMAMYGASVGNVSISNIDACTNQACCVMLPKEEASAQYLFYALMDSQAFLKHKALGGTQPNISQVIIRNHKIPVPSKKEQTAIVDYLDTHIAAIDSILKTKRKQIDVLKRRRQSLIYEYVTGKRRVRKEI